MILIRKNLIKIVKYKARKINYLDKYRKMKVLKKKTPLCR